MTAELNRKGAEASVVVATMRFKTAALSRLKQISPYFIAMALFSGGLYALHRLLAPVHLRDVMLEVHSTPT